MSGKREGKIALVTGGTAGIGLATVRRFVKEGAYVFVTGRRQAELDAIRVNVISPGPIETPGIARLAPNEEQRKRSYSMLASQVPLGRWGSRMKLLNWRSSLLPTIQAS